jgi:hypothetical protein
VAHSATGGGEAGGWLWSQPGKEEKAEACKGEGKLVVGTVGVAKEKAVALAAFGKDKRFWARWWPLLLLLSGSRWQRRRFLQRREREREVVQPPREMV